MNSVATLIVEPMERDIYVWIVFSLIKYLGTSKNILFCIENLLQIDLSVIKYKKHKPKNTIVKIENSTNSSKYSKIKFFYGAN